MKKLCLILLAVGLVGVVAFYLYHSQSQSVENQIIQTDGSVPEIDAYFAAQNQKIQFVDAENTAKLKNLLGMYAYNQVPRVYVRNFPSDFAQNGDLDTFIRTLLPYILRQNELLQLERRALLNITEKIHKDYPLTEKEEAFFNTLIEKYETLERDYKGHASALYHRVDRISPSLAVVQALEATEYMKTNFQSPFGVRRWNAQKEYQQVVYPNLAKAVEDYALEINRGLSYDLFHNKRSIYRGSHYELPGRAFVKGFDLYKSEQKDYIQKITKFLDDFDEQDVDFATFKKGN